MYSSQTLIARFWVVISVKCSVGLLHAILNIVSYFCVVMQQVYTCPTNPLTFLKPWNSSIDKIYIVQKCRSTELKAIKLWKGQWGGSKVSGKSRTVSQPFADMCAYECCNFVKWLRWIWNLTLYFGYPSFQRTFWRATCLWVSVVRKGFLHEPG